MIEWFARNGVAANLVMFVIVVGGLTSLLSLKQELFPQFSLDTVVIRVPYLGASPEEVESAIILRLEEAIEGVEGIKEVRSSAREGLATVAVELRKGARMARVKDDLKTRVDSILSFPVETERPTVEEQLIQRDVIWVAMYGRTSESALKEIAERVRSDLTSLPGVSQASVQGMRDYEISIEVPEVSLREYGLTFDEVVSAVRRHSLDVPGGTIKTRGGEILLRTQEQAYRSPEFERIPLKTALDGTVIRVGDVGRVVDGFSDDPVLTRFNGQPAALVLVREVGNESPLAISREVNRYVQEAQSTWVPEGITLATWGDSSFYLKGRLRMLIQNGLYGFILVLLVLSLFLRPSLAFFVAIGIPISFLGTFLLAPFIGISVNLVSLFAFILVLGIVVDDAIVVGESVFSEFQRSGPGVEASISGTHQVAIPVTFAVLTTAVAFLPVFLLPGQLGKFFSAIPVVVIPTLLFSLIQSKLVLPYHLSLCHVGDRKHRSALNPLSRVQRKVADALESFVREVYQPWLDRAARRRYLTLSVFTGVFIVGMAFLAGGWVRFSPFPSVPSDFIQIELLLPEGTPIEHTEGVLRRISHHLDSIVAEDVLAGKGNPVLHQMEFIGLGQGARGANRGFFLLELTKSEVRDSSADEVADRLRTKIGTIPGARRLVINASAGPPTGLPIDIRLTGPDFDHLQLAAREIKDRLAEFPGVFDIRDTFSEGKREIKLRLLDRAATLGVTANDLARQVRAAFYGAEAQRIQRGRDDIRVMIRFPASERISIGNLEGMRIRTPAGVEIPIHEVAALELGEGFPAITRIDRQRVINIQADADKEAADFNAINRALYGGRPGDSSLLKEMQERYPGLTLVKGGEAKDWEETRESLIGGAIMVCFLIYTLLAVPFRSYTQPLLVMAVIPFGFTGALLGHWVTGQSLSILSFLGVIALSGVVVNDSLVLVDFVNRRRREGADEHEAILRAGAARFRPILLTSLTTFVGLVPVLLERSLQAQFLIPMATSLAFGVIFATLITLFLVPAMYLVLEDFHNLRIRWLEHLRPPTTPD